MKKHILSVFSLSFTTIISTSFITLAQSNITNPFTVTGGNSEVNSGKTPSIQIKEIQQGNSSDPNRQTWIVIHGWNDSPDNTDLRGIANTIASQKPNDRVLMLDWSQASHLKFLQLGTPGAVGDTGKAATWISPVAREVFNKLKEEVSSQNLNLVGHSLGALLSSEIARTFKNAI